MDHGIKSLEVEIHLQLLWGQWHPLLVGLLLSLPFLDLMLPGEGLPIEVRFQFPFIFSFVVLPDEKVMPKYTGFHTKI